uniref:Laminin EGF-like domain-containing protein n=1 Tax=Tetranychus urticae TaxID=32264 RepID=T1K905_TETUR
MAIFLICTSYFSSLRQSQYGEVNLSLLEGRPGANLLTETLKQFMKARFVRLRLQKIQSPLDGSDVFTNPDRYNLTSVNQLFYTLQSLEIIGQCICNGHARACPIDRGTLLRKCDCLHNTCGDNCEKCCPLFNQKPYRQATKRNSSVCEVCQCNGHSTECIYDKNVDARNGSVNIFGQRSGGGVCINCQSHTTGNNCDQCEDGYFRPKGVVVNDTSPCRPCQCRGRGTTEYCIKDSSHVLTGLDAGDCICKKGFQGKYCDSCAPGYRNYPRCDSCYCNGAGVVNPEACDGPCICKANVEGARCDRCKQGYFDLSADNPDGCAPCFCFGATNTCKSSDWGSF